MSSRAKGQRNEVRMQKLLESWGYTVFRLYQPRYTPQGVLDMIAVGHGRVRFLQSRSNQWHDLRPLKTFTTLMGDKPLIATVEAWLWTDGEREPRQRVME